MTRLLSIVRGSPWHLRRTTALLWLLTILAAASLTGCNPISPDDMPEVGSESPSVTSRTLSSSPIQLGGSGQSVSLTMGSQVNKPVGPAEVIMGTGRFVNPSATSSGAQPIATGSDVTLDFANVDVRDVMKSVLGDLLKLSYSIDPAVQGTITLQTGRPIPRTSVIDTLTTTLQVNGIALVVRDGVYLAVPIANAARQAPLGGVSGFVTRVVTPQYIAASDLERVIEPLLPPGTTIKADPSRNLLLVSGAARDVATVLSNVATFDVDYLQGMSFALLPLRNGKARDIAADVNNLLTSNGKSISDTVKVMPIERMNAVLVTSMQPAYLARVRGWVERFDRGNQRSDTQLFVYRVQNGRAVDIARVLRRALGLDQGEASGPDTTGGPDSSNTQVGASTGAQSATNTITSALGMGAGNQAASTPAASAAQAQSNPLAGVATAASLAGGAAPDVRVTADATNNAVIVTATAQDYAPIEAALEKLDIPPLQVLIEATVAEVTLQNQLSFGLQYFIKSGNFAGIFAPGVAPLANATSTVSSSVGSTVTSTFPGFSFLSGANVAYSSGGTNIVLQALSKLTTTRVLSSPNLLVLNNGTARLQVGDQVPIATQSATSTLTNTAQTVNAINYRDTGVILTVTPRVNASGLVLLDISEEVSDVSKTTTSDLDSPTISQRRVTSTVAVHDGQTIGLAGLIRENRGTGNSGLPVLKDIPVLGWLFGLRSNAVTRTELLVLITPQVIRGRDDGDAITEELRRKLRLTIPVVARRR